MYVPAHFAVDEGQLGQLLDDFPVADLVTVTPQGCSPRSSPSFTNPRPVIGAPLSAMSLGATNSGAALCSLRRW